MGFNIRALSVPIFFIAYLVLSIVLFVKREKLLNKYDIGYISSFFFASYMLAPVFFIIAAIADPAFIEESDVPVGIYAIYPIIGLVIFFVINREYTLEYKIGKLFAMIGIGICAGYVLIFNIFKFSLFSDSSSSTIRSQTKTPIPNMTTTNDIFRGRINEYGEIYDYGGKLLARINEHGDIYYPNGTYFAHIDSAGDIYDSAGNYLGRIRNGEIQNANWSTVGKINND